MSSTKPTRRSSRPRVLKGYKHLPVDDRPVPYTDGITEELELGLHFHYEMIVRDIYNDRSRLQYIIDRMAELDELAKLDR